MTEAGPSKVPPMYAALRQSVRFCLSVFFRQISVVGGEHIPSSGPVIFVGNHPNSLIDPALIIATCGRVVSFAAKDVLFRSALLRPVLRGLGAVPIARRQDHGGGTVDNRTTFAALIDALGCGGTMGIFPEGISHDDAQLARMKTGAARIAFLAEEAHPGAGLVIIPCGLCYVSPKHFRSRVLVQFGAPIRIGESPARGGGSAENQEAVRALTSEIDARLRSLTINAEDWETVRVLDGVRRLYQPPRISLHDRIELARRFTRVYPKVAQKPDIVALFERIRDYLDRLDATGLDDRDLVAGSDEQLARRSLMHALELLVFLPLALPGLVFFFPLGLIVGKGGARLSPRKDVVATTKLVMGVVGLALLHVIAIASVAFFFGWPFGLGAFVVLIVSGWATLRVLKRFHRLATLSKRALRAMFFGSKVADLRAERAELAREVGAAVDRHIPDDMSRLFGGGDSGSS